MSKHCEDCGCKTYNGICSNCHEELYILEYQGEFVESVSEEFLNAAKRQKEQVDEAINRNRLSCPAVARGDSLDYDIEDDFITKRGR